ncbi:MAG: Gfo/Idh/MocA family oxidoreductase [Spirochaetaceae bacterium]
MKEIKIGIIGIGLRSDISKHAHNPELNVFVTAGADPYKDARDNFSEKYPDADLYEDYRILLKSKDIDAVMICSPDNLHEEHAIASLEAGKDVFLEKPMAITIEGCDRILDTVKKTGQKLYLGHNMRHMDSILTMKKIIDEGTIGEIQAVWCRHFISYGGDAYFKDWHSEQKNTTGLLLQKGAHDIDVIHWLAGGYTESVVGMGKLSVYDKCKRRNADERGVASFRPDIWPAEKQDNLSLVIDVEDHNMILMQLDNGVQASYTQCHYAPDAWRSYTFIGTKGRIENRGDSGNSTVEVYTKRTDVFGQPDIIYNLNGNEAGHEVADVEIVNRFIDYIRFNKEPNTSPIAARNAVAAGVMATESIRNGNIPKVVNRYE